MKNKEHDNNIKNDDSKIKLAIVWGGLIFLSAFLDFGYYEGRCINGQAVECSGIDFANLIIAPIIAFILYKHWSKFESNDINNAKKWGRNAAVVAGIGVFISILYVTCDCSF